MKIISKYKDYYDYLQGVYGIDEKIVFDRRHKNETMYKPSHIEFAELEKGKIVDYIFAICGIIYVVYIYNGKYYFGDDVKRILKAGNYRSWHFQNNQFDLTALEYHLKKTDINDKEQCPVCLLGGGRHNEHFVKSNTVRLSDFGFPQIISPHDMYINIGNFLSREKKIVDKRTDIQKIVGKGFDKKTSFRNVK